MTTTLRWTPSSRHWYLYSQSFCWYMHKKTSIHLKDLENNHTSLVSVQLWLGGKQRAYSVTTIKQATQPFCHTWGHWNVHVHCKQISIMINYMYRDSTPGRCTPFVSFCFKDTLQPGSLQTEFHALWVTKWKSGILSQWHSLLWQFKQQKAICHLLQI